jgi:hypothetical protein
MPFGPRLLSPMRRRLQPRVRRPLFEALERRTLLATITVTSTDDSVNDNGQVTLRAAIESIDAGADVNSAVTAHRVGSYLGGNPSPDEIAFDIPGSGVQTIDLTSALPSISKPIFIDGYTQPGASANTDSTAQGLDSVLLIQIDAASAGYLGNGVVDLAAGDSTVRGLVINQAQGPDVELDGDGHNLIEGDFLGTSASGTQVFPPNSSTGGTLDGIYLKSSVSNTIGGTAAADRNLISGNGANGIEVPLYLDTGNLIEGNLIGTDITGTKALGNGISGVDMYGGNGSNSTVGGAAAGAGNVISGNPVGVEVAGPYVIQGNSIGTDPSGTLNVGNSNVGVLVSANGSGAQIIGNTIAFNGNGAPGGEGAGVQIDSGDTNGNGNLVSQNSIFSNVGIGIELGAEGAAPNQPPPTAGPNNSQNYPILNSATATGGGTEIQGTLTSVAGDTFRLEFFANAARDETTFSDIQSVPPGEFSEGQTYIGALDVPVGASGNATFTARLPALPTGEPFVTATATDITNTGSGPANNTSEFSPVVPLGGASFVVTNTGDSGLGTLREAIYSADNAPGSHTITFDIPPSDPRHFYYTNDGVAGQVSQSDVATTTAANDSAIANIDPDWPHSWYSIQPASSLPPLFDINSIDGYSQTGSSQNTLSAVQQGLNTVLTIEIDGQDVTGDGLALEPDLNDDAGTGTIEGLAINRFGGNGITMSSLSGDIIAGNFIGTDVSGSLALGNAANGIYVEDVDDFTIGGSTNDAANLISGNGENGIYVVNEGITGQIEGNLVGGGRSIAPALPNAEAAVDIEPDADATTSAVQPNAQQIPGYVYISGGFEYIPFAILVRGHTNSGGKAIGAAILKGFAEPASFSSGHSGSISSLAAPGTPGPAIDLEDGANPLTNAPVLTAALTAAGTTITGTLSSQPSDTYLIQFYSNTQLLPAGYGPGEQYIGSVDMTTSAGGNGSFTFQAPTAIPVGQFITATATLLDSSGNPLETSQFSTGVPVDQGTASQGPVTINPIPAQTIAPGATLNVQVTARDPDQGATLVYSLGAGAPAGAAINPSSGLLTWTPSLAQAGDTGEIAVTVAVQGAPRVTDTTSLSFTVLSPPVVKGVSTTKLVKRRVNEGTSTINIVFSEAMAPLAGSSSFYSVDTPKKARVHGKITTKLVPIRFTARFTGANSVSLKLAKPSKLHLTLIVRAGDPAANGVSVGENVTFTVQ